MKYKSLLIALVGCLVIACEAQQGDKPADQMSAEEKNLADPAPDLPAPAVGRASPGTCFTDPGCPAGRESSFGVTKERCASHGGASFQAEDGCTDI